MLPGESRMVVELLQRIARTLDHIDQLLTQPNSYVMRDGTVLSRADIQRLAEEAEHGYDPNQIGPERRVNPS